MGREFIKTINTAPCLRGPGFSFSHVWEAAWKLHGALDRCWWCLSHSLSSFFRRSSANPRLAAPYACGGACTHNHTLPSLNTLICAAPTTPPCGDAATACACSMRACCSLRCCLRCGRRVTTGVVVGAGRFRVRPDPTANPDDGLLSRLGMSHGAIETQPCTSSQGRVWIRLGRLVCGACAARINERVVAGGCAPLLGMHGTARVLVRSKMLQAMFAQRSRLQGRRCTARKARVLP